MAAAGPTPRPFAGHLGPIFAVAFAPDGATLATVGGDGTVRIWDAGTGAELRHLTGQISAVAFAPDGATLATGSSDGTARIWDARTGTELRQVTHSERSVT